MLSLWRKLRWSIVHRGPLGTLRAAGKAVRHRLRPGSARGDVHPFDQRYGVDTSGVMAGGSLASGHPNDIHIEGYAGIAPSRFEAAIDRWRTSLGHTPLEDYTFIDLGCGKGRALLLASRLPFRQVLGVEINPQLAAIARQNVAHWMSLGEARSRVSVDLGDASELTPPGGPCLLFLYNPFAEPLVRRLADIVGRAEPQWRIDLLYQNAEHASVFSPQLGFRELWRGALALSPEDAAADAVASPKDITVLLRHGR